MISGTKSMDEKIIEERFSDNKDRFSNTTNDS